jgi:hypothetical protein
MTRINHTRGEQFPKVERLDWNGAPVLHRDAATIAGHHIEAYTSLTDLAGKRTLVVTGGQATPLLARIVVGTPRQKASDRHPVCEWVNVTTLTPGCTDHAAYVAFWAREWGLVGEEVAA